MALLHVVALLITVPFILYADWMGGRWLRGIVPTLPKKQVLVPHTMVSFGLIALILTGGIMFIDRAQFLLTQPAFIAKILFVGVLVINGFFIGILSAYATELPFAKLTQSQKRAVLFSGAISSIGWVTVILLGLYIGS